MYNVNKVLNDRENIIIIFFFRFGNKVHMDAVAFSIVHLATTVLYWLVYLTLFTEGGGP